MRTAIDILADARSQGFELSVLDGGLAVRPQSKLSPELRSELTARKPAVLAILLAGDGRATPTRRLTPTPNFDWMAPYRSVPGMREFAATAPNPPLVEPGAAVCRYHCGDTTGLCVRCQRAHRAHLPAPLLALAHMPCHYCGEDFWTMWQRPGSLPGCRACREGS
jgi:hypothetical protein